MSQDIVNVKISDFIKVYLDRLVKKFPEITEIWLFGSRANSMLRATSDWDLLVFSTPKVLNDLKTNKDLNHEDIDILIVYDDDHFESPWANISKEGVEITKSGSLKNWEFTKIDEKEATYKSAKKGIDNHIEIQKLKMYKIR